MRMRTGNRGLTRAELGIRLCSSSCKGMAHQIPAAPLSSSSRTGGGTPSITGSHPRAPGAVLSVLPLSRAVQPRPGAPRPPHSPAPCGSPRAGGRRAPAGQSGRRGCPRAARARRSASPGTWARPGAAGTARAGLRDRLPAPWAALAQSPDSPPRTSHCCLVVRGVLVVPGVQGC